jgi:general secretion pathway protein C
MRFDDVFKRCFVVVVCFMLGAAAYFQAAGMMKLAGASLDLDPQSIRSMIAAARVTAASPSGSPAGGAFGHETRANVILERNPFDSITGSLVGGKGSGGEGEAPSPPVFGADPYGDPPCDGARVLLISASEDPEWSFAAIAGDGQRPVLRRLGDDVGGRQVFAVGRDRVWLASSQGRCQSVLGAPLVSGGPGRGKDGLAQGGGVAKPREDVNQGALPPDVADKIRVLSERQIEVDRSVIAPILERPRDLLGSVRVTPQKDGLRLLGIKPGSLLGTIGLKNGDKLTKVNGMDVSDPKAALELYARLSSADHLVVSVDRRGEPMNIDVAIK